MSDRTKISWADATWNPLRGCSRVSAGCYNCYAMHMARRFCGQGQPYAGLTRLGPDWSGKVRFLPEMLAQPLRWRRPRRIFVCSMSDLFHEAVSDEDIAAVFGVMAAAPQHTFIVLTKRPERMRAWFEWAADNPRTACRVSASSYICRPVEREPFGQVWPLPNVHVYTSIEDQPTADTRIQLLMDTPAAVRGVSIEPMLAPVDLDQLDALDHVIVGGESGSQARPCHVEWIRYIVRQCQRSKVPCYVKQLGSHYVDAENGIGGVLARPDPTLVPPIRHLKSRKGEDMVEWPEDLRVRELP